MTDDVYTFDTPPVLRAFGWTEGKRDDGTPYRSSWSGIYLDCGVEAPDPAAVCMALAEEI